MPAYVCHLSLMKIDFERITSALDHTYKPCNPRAREIKNIRDIKCSQSSSDWSGKERAVEVEASRGSCSLWALRGLIQHFVWSLSGFSPTFTFPLSFPAPKAHTGTKAKVSEGWGCDAGLEGVDPLGGPDGGPSSFFFSPNPHSEWAQRGESPQSNTHERVYCEWWALLQ